MNTKFVNIILILIVLILLLLDGFAIHDLLMEEPDIMYEVSVLAVSVLVFIAIWYYLKQRKKSISKIQ